MKTGRDEGVRIIGAGFAGLGAAHRLHAEGVRATVWEAHAHPGGHTSSHAYKDGFIFDEGPHISFTKNTRMQELLADSVGQDFQAFTSKVNNHWKGHWIKHPAQVNLAGLPVDLVTKCLADFIHAQHAEPGEINNYEDWLYASFGKTFADTFPGEYTKKYHTTEAKNLTTEWVGVRLYRPKIEEVLRGALTKETPNVHYIPDFRYPTHGGFVAYLDKFIAQADVKLNSRVAAIDPKAKTVTFADGRTEPYGRLISSCPLPALIPMIKGAPKKVKEAAARLACSQAVLVNIGINRPDASEQSWSYFYDEDYPFARLSFPANYSPKVVPPGTSSIQAEIYFSDKYRPFSGKTDDWIEPTIASLLRCGILRDRVEVIHTSTLWAPWGNVIFDHDRTPSLKLVHAFLEEVGIAWCGRYGDWGYLWTDESFMSGERAASMTLDALARS